MKGRAFARPFVLPETEAMLGEKEPVKMPIGSSVFTDREAGIRLRRGTTSTREGVGAWNAQLDRGSGCGHTAI